MDAAGSEAATIIGDFYGKRVESTGTKTVIVESQHRCCSTGKIK